MGKTPFTLALPIIDTPDYALGWGAGPRLVVVWKEPVCPAMFDGEGNRLVPEDFRWYECLAMDEMGTNFKLRLARDVVEKAVREPRYFIEAEGIRGPTLGITGHGALVKV